MSLDDYFGNKDTKLTKFKNVFYFDNINYTACWLDTVPKDCNFIKKINWKEYKIEVTLCSKLSDADIYESLNKEKNKIPLLKSHLQKNIRRNEIKKALQCAKEFIDIDFNQFLRRINIIMLEDCILHNSFNVVSWMTATLGKWKPHKKDIEYCLSIVEFLAGHKNIDPRDELTFDFKKNIKSINLLDTQHRDLMYSMEFRKSYGGMHGDIKMISYFCDKWLKRFLKHENCKYINNLSINLESRNYYDTLVYLKKYDVYAVDFHNNPQLLDKLEKIYIDKKFTKDDFKKAIWYFRSSLTVKIPYDNCKLITSEDNLDKYKKIFSIIEECLDTLSDQYIKKVNY